MAKDRLNIVIQHCPTTAGVKRLAAFTIFLSSSHDAYAFEVNKYFNLPTKVETTLMVNEANSSPINPIQDQVYTTQKYHYQLGLQLSPRIQYKYFSIRGDVWLFEDAASNNPSLGEKNDRFLSQLKMNEVKILTNEALAEINLFDKILVGGGKSNMKWGPGYYWNPSMPFSDSLLNNLDSIRSYKKAGDNAGYIESSFKSLNLRLVGQQHDSVKYVDDNSTEKYTSTLVRGQFFLEKWDVATNIGLINSKNFFSFSVSLAATTSLELHMEAAYQPSNKQPTSKMLYFQPDEEYEKILFYEYNNLDKPYGDALIGGQYTMENNTNIIIEYIYNGSGYSRNDFSSLFEHIATARSTINDPTVGRLNRGFLAISNFYTQFMMRRNYLFMRLAPGFTIWKTSFNCYQRLSLDDLSLVLGSSLKKRLSKFSEIGVDSQYIYGSRHTEGELSPYQTRITIGGLFNF